MGAALKRIWRCWAVLMLLLASTTAIAFLPLGRFNAFIAIAIAACKALLVLIVFMELKRSAGLVRAFAAAGFFWLLILLTLTSADYLTRRDTTAPWQADGDVHVGVR
jgi:cytochrome c oxidase subunit 4